MRTMSRISLIVLFAATVAAGCSSGSSSTTTTAAPSTTAAPATTAPAKTTTSTTAATTTTTSASPAGTISTSNDPATQECISAALAQDPTLAAAVKAAAAPSDLPLAQQQATMLIAVNCMGLDNVSTLIAQKTAENKTMTSTQVTCFANGLSQMGAASVAELMTGSPSSEVVQATASALNTCTGS